MDSPKLVAFDLDGTLTESKQPITREMIGLLEELLKRIPIAVMSGASFTQFQDELVAAFSSYARLERLYLFPTSGAACYAYQSGQWVALYNNQLTETEAQKIFSAFDQALERTGLKEPPQRVWGERLENRGSQMSFSALGQRAPVEEKKKWHDLFDGRRQELRATLERLLPEFDVRAGGMTTVDVTKKGMNKAYAITKLSELTRIPVSGMLYMGDALYSGGNDEVVKQAGITTQEVKGPLDTAEVLKTLIAKLPVSTTPPPRLTTNTPNKSPMSSQGIWTGVIATVVVLLIIFGVVFLWPQYGSQITSTQGDTNVTPSGSLPTNSTSTVSTDFINVTSLHNGDLVTSPLTVEGNARGNWYFEASFPVELRDGNGKVIAQTHADAQSDWMTTDFVPFTVTLTFTAPQTATGILILKNDNPSGDPARDMQIEVPVRFR